jgi:hypothetical protein
MDSAGQDCAEIMTMTGIGYGPTLADPRRGLGALHAPDERSTDSEILILLVGIALGAAGLQVYRDRQHDAASH